MCGIAGVVLEGEGAISPELLHQMLHSIRHRGPDDEGIYCAGPVGLGAVRLSILDLSPAGHQPMANEDETLWLVYNGELYNFRELKKDLERQGHRFRSQTDTEVVLHAYESEGVDCVKRFNGMFAFALWDSKRRRLFCARDPLGVKPFYYYFDGRRLVFASEIKAILQDPKVPRQIYLPGLNNYFTFAHSVAPETLYERIWKLPPGHFFIWENGKLRFQNYWDVPEEEKRTRRSPREHVEEVRTLLREAVRMQMVSDVPVGVFLSGGIDSSSVLAFASEFSSRPVKTFSVGFQDATYSELGDARLVAERFGADHNELIITPQDVPPILEKLAWHYDEPFADSAAIPVYLLSRFARESVVVVLTGEGGDEIFGGYRRYTAEQYASLYHTVLPSLARKGIRQLVSLLPGFRRGKKFVQAMSVTKPADRYAEWLTTFDDLMKRQLFNPEVYDLLCKTEPRASIRSYYGRFHSLTDQLLYVDLKVWLPDTYLEKMDKASMARSLEARVPLLDHRLVELAFELPPRLRIRRFQRKVVLRQAMKDILPPQILRKPKYGFTAPTDYWFRTSLRAYVNEVLSDGFWGRTGLFNTAYINRLITLHQQGKEVLDYHIYLLIAFAHWYHVYMANGLRLDDGSSCSRDTLQVLQAKAGTVREQ